MEINAIWSAILFYGRQFFRQFGGRDEAFVFTLGQMYAYDVWRQTLRRGRILPTTYGTETFGWVSNEWASRCDRHLSTN